MTRAILLRQAGELAGFELEGHAGYGRHGSDIVCSALSAVTHMAAIGITEVLGLKALIKTDEDRGRMLLLLRAEDVKAAQVLLRTLEKELGCIAGQYPDHLRIIYAERREFKCFS